jgi:hypothetical protein
MSEQQEKKNRRIAMAASVGFHGLLLIAFMLMMAWRAPNPPLPEYGIEVNFGMDDQGGGDIQPEESPGAEEETQTQQEEVQPQEEEVVEQTVAEKPVEQVVSKVESPVVVKEEKKETVKEVAKEKPVESKPKETPKEEVKPTDAKVTDGKKGEATTSQGDDKGKVGDKGNPEGKLDAKALYGQPGGGGGGDGFGLSMAGWAWADDPKVPNLPDNEDGRIEFEIECDSEGEIVSIKTIQRGLSPKAEQLLRDEILRNSLMRTSAGKVPERSKGRVVFILKTK